ncbi:MULTISPECIES: cation:proton antiporter family protein [unclassified Halomonas]|uniref:cation:proton antiporter family protein n=1 Tax=unclassified Halomonas TaxID=2609666 RepID=UPI002887808A|nr:MULTISPECIES: cation:proton antiporter family protein [unclassified Halomonas]MDT0501873.1 cation:proton antiporter [Halomonas sp. PAR7]MDT0513544.1 cation:proton antiporter [Halomonas sp. LES1]MDT0592534.1 cation:proton antiporter [Halomonas sp. PAR8]
MIEPAFLLAAFLGGVAALAIRLPPLVGFLAAGFVLNAIGYDETPLLALVSEVGVTLLLFTIGLKLDVRTLLRREVWGGTSLHMIGSSLLFCGLLVGLKGLGLTLLADSQWQTLLLLGFALSFSSTVFVIKVLEKRSETQTAYGRLAIGVLIMQDIFAVLFITASTGKLPSPWALGLVLLIPLAPLLRQLLDRLGHGEMQILFGMLLALVLGYALFEALGVKGDLGALIIGLLLAPHPAAQTLSRSMFNIKELLLVGFFLSIGLTAMPNASHVQMALLLVALLPLKSLLYLLVFMRFPMRNRTAVLATLSLSNYSEFGLIVGAIAVAGGLLDGNWLVVISLAVALSFGLSSMLNAVSEGIYRWLEPRLPERDPSELSPSDRPIEVGDAEAVVLGMGRIGRSVYRRLQKQYGLRVLGIDSNPASVKMLAEREFNIVEGDALDSDFWDKLLMSPDVRMVVLSMPHHAGNLFALKQLRSRQFDGRITAVVEFPEEIEPIRELGASAVFHVYDKAGRALADSAAEESGIEPISSQLG